MFQYFVFGFFGKINKFKNNLLNKFNYNESKLYIPNIKFDIPELLFNFNNKVYSPDKIKKNIKSLIVLSPLEKL